jgi:hypothetical protein
MTIRLVLSLVAVLIVTATLALQVVVAPLLPERIHVRWASAVTADQRGRLERELSLASGTYREGRTWSYALRDRSPQQIERLVRHPSVEDTHYLDRENFTLLPDAGDRPAWMQAVARSSLFQQVQPWLLTMAVVVGAAGVTAAWPILRRPRRWLQRVAIAMGASALQSVELKASLPRGRFHVTVLAFIMLISMLLRIDIVLGGGQFYWGDESRYAESRDIAAGLGSDGMSIALRRMSNGQHPLFAVVGVIPAIVERVIGTDSRIPGVFFAAFSVLNIGLLALIAKRCGASDTEAVVAAALLALSVTFFYFARHLLPYDVAMFFGLVALYLGVGHATRPLVSALCGVFAACAFLTYLGYWTLGGTALVIHVLRGRDRATVVSRAVLGAVGLIAPILLLIVATNRAGGRVLTTVSGFSGNVDQGTFSEGWRLPWEYLWHSEHLIVILWLLGTAWCLVRIRSASLSPTARVGLLGLALTYGSLVLFSSVLERFVVYGRLARQMVPFLCLTTAAAIHEIDRLLPSKARLSWMATLTGLSIAQAAFNFATPLRQVFPAEFLRDTQAHAHLPDKATLMTINARHLYPGPTPVTWPSRFTILKEASHPLEFLPYQYEGFTPEQRATLRSSDLTMRMVAVLP